MAFCYAHRYTPCSAMLIDLCLALPSSEKLPPAADGNKYRDLWLKNMQRVKDLGILSISTKPHPTGFREPYRRKAERLQEPLGMEDPKDKRPSQHSRMNACMNSETLVACTEAAQVWVRWGPTLRVEMDTLTQMLFPIDNNSQMKN